MSLDAPIVHLVDHDEAFLLAMARLLRASGFVVKTARSAGDFLAQRESDTPGCLITDSRLPEVSGLELQAALSRMGERLPVIFLTGSGDIPSSVRAMRGGAEDYLEKRAPKEQLLDAVRRALERDARERLERTRQRALRARFDRLTEREREVLSRVVRGQQNKQIAADLGIGERMVKMHRTAITTKLGVPSVAELTRLTDEAALFSRSDFPQGEVAKARGHSLG